MLWFLSKKYKIKSNYDETQILSFACVKLKKDHG